MLLARDIHPATVAKAAIRRSKEGLVRLLDILDYDLVQLTVDRLLKSRIVDTFDAGAWNLDSSLSENERLYDRL